MKLNTIKYMKVNLVTNPFEPAIVPIKNHEIWRKCERCGAEYDLRKTDKCDECKKKTE